MFESNCHNVPVDVRISWRIWKMARTLLTLITRAHWWEREHTADIQRRRYDNPLVGRVLKPYMHGAGTDQMQKHTFNKHKHAAMWTQCMHSCMYGVHACIYICVCNDMYSCTHTDMHVRSLLHWAPISRFGARTSVPDQESDTCRRFHSLSLLFLSLELRYLLWN